MTSFQILSVTYLFKIICGWPFYRYVCMPGMYMSSQPSINRCFKNRIIDIFNNESKGRSKMIHCNKLYINTNGMCNVGGDWKRFLIEWTERDISLSAQQICLAPVIEQLKLIKYCKFYPYIIQWYHLYIFYRYL